MCAEWLCVCVSAGAGVDGVIVSVNLCVYADSIVCFHVDVCVFVLICVYVCIRLCVSM